ncbi:U32 family peptidase [Bacillota bacterium LX-D]|nr:U32 family peptidase [Bacillota bacterium LX-D]
MTKKVELLAPAGNLEKLKIALLYGADAVYLGGQQFGLRASAGNFSLDELEKGIKIAHNLNKKVYVTINIYAHNDDLTQLSGYLTELQHLSIDGLLISDPGVFLLAKEFAPQFKIHISTQANTTNWVSCKFWQDLGAERIVLARELSLAEISEIHARVPITLEAFVHGAMCMAYSGRCMLSSFLAERSANRGECTHPCRWKYHLVEEKRPGEYMSIEEDEHGSYILNSKDLCMIEHLPLLIKAGVSSLKIEGRMKSIHYVATVVKAYRQAIDAYYKGFPFDMSWLEELEKVSEREYTTGFYFSKPGKEDHNYISTKTSKNYEFVGMVLNCENDKDLVLVEQRNKFSLGDDIEVFGPNTSPKSFVVTEMYDEDGNAIATAPHPKQKLYIKIKFPIEKFSLLRRKK